MTLTLDHVVIAVRDLDVAAQNYRRLFGRAPSWRGRHPAYGTANVLFRLDNTYIELLAPANGDTSSPWLAALRAHLDSGGEGLYALALGTGDIDRAVTDARARGLTVAGPAAGDGVDLDSGARREWRNARIDPAATRNVRLFFIEHLSPPGALPLGKPDAPAAACPHAVDHTVVASSDLAAGLALWRDALGLDLRATVDFPPPDGPRRLCFLRLGDSILELAGRRPTDDPRVATGGTSDQQPAPALELAGASPPRAAPERSEGTSDQRPATSDQLWGVSYRVADIAACVDRLRAGGLAVSDVRAGNAPGTLVADLKPGFSHDVRTLFIQQEAPA